MGEDSKRRREPSPRRRRSRSRSRSRHRDRTRDRDRDRDRDRRRSRSRSRDRERTRERRRSPARAHSERGSLQAAYGTTFASGGRVFEDNGGLPELGGQEAQHQQAGGHRQQYEASLRAGLEGTLEAGPPAGASGEERRRRSGPAPSRTLYVRAVPEAAGDAELAAAFQGWPGLEAVRITRDRATGALRGFAFVDFETQEAAQAVMESEQRYFINISGQRLLLEYSLAPAPSGLAAAAGPGSAASAAAAASTLDWLCSMCQAVNFSRRLECYQCSTPRGPAPARVSAGPEGPSPILKVSSLEPQTSEQELLELFASVTPPVEVRMARDKFTGVPRGFAFVEFSSIADAGRALLALQGAVLAGQAAPLRLCYARDRATTTPSLAVGAGADALAAAQAMSQYSGWQPKEFDEEQDAAAASNNGATGGVQQEQAPEQAQQQQQQPGFVYDSTTGYWYDAASGYYYDANTGLYCHAATQQWGAYDADTGQFTPATSTVDAAQHPQAQGQLEHTAAAGSTAAALSIAEHSASAAADAAVEAAGSGDAAQWPAPAVAAASAQVRRSSAVIGAAPALSAEGLLAAAQAAAQAKLDALTGALPVRQRSKPKPGGQGRGQPLRNAGAAQLGAAAAGGPLLDGAVHAAAPSAAGTTVTPVSGAVSGVIHRGRWAPKPAAQ